MKDFVSRSLLGVFAFFIMTLCVVSCGGGPSVAGSPGVPEPIKVLENPQTDERVRFYKEIWFKRAKGYRQAKHMADWTESQNRADFTKEVSPADDRESLAALRAKNRAANRLIANKRGE